MILYKYVTLDIGEKIINDCTLSFTKPINLNDPFEIKASSYKSADRDYFAEENKENILIASQTYGVLSLSRTPLNPLMWSHYAKGKRTPPLEDMHQIKKQLLMED